MIADDDLCIWHQMKVRLQYMIVLDALQFLVAPWGSVCILSSTSKRCAKIPAPSISCLQRPAESSSSGIPKYCLATASYWDALLIAVPLRKLFVWKAIKLTKPCSSLCSTVPPTNLSDATGIVDYDWKYEDWWSRRETLFPINLQLQVLRISPTSMKYDAYVNIWAHRFKLTQEPVLMTLDSRFLLLTNAINLFCCLTPSNAAFDDRAVFGKTECQNWFQFCFCQTAMRDKGGPKGDDLQNWVSKLISVLFLQNSDAR